MENKSTFSINSLTSLVDLELILSPWHFTSLKQKTRPPSVTPRFHRMVYSLHNVPKSPRPGSSDHKVDTQILLLWISKFCLCANEMTCLRTTEIYSPFIRLFVFSCA